MPDTAAAVVDDEDAPVRKKSPPPPAKSAKAAKAPADGSSPFGAFVAACSDAGYTWDDDKKVFTFTDEEKLRPHSASSGGDEYTSIAHAVEAINARDHKLKALSDHVAELEKLLDDKRDEVGDKVDAVLAKYQDGSGLEGDKPSDVKENTKPQNAQETKASKNAKAAETKTHVPDKKSKAADSKPPPPASKDGGDTGDEKAAKPTENKKGKPANDDATRGDNKDASAETKKLKVVTEATTADATEGDTVEEDAIVKPRKAKSSKTGKSDGSEKTTIKARVEAKLEAQHAGDQESKVNHTKPKRSRSRKAPPPPKTKKGDKSSKKSKGKSSSKKAPPPPKDKKRRNKQKVHPAADADVDKTEYTGTPTVGDKKKQAAQDGDMVSPTHGAVVEESSAPFLNTTAV